MRFISCRISRLCCDNFCDVYVFTIERPDCRLLPIWVISTTLQSLVKIFDSQSLQETGFDAWTRKAQNPDLGVRKSGKSRHATVAKVQMHVANSNEMVGPERRQPTSNYVINSMIITHLLELMLEPQGFDI